MTHVKDTALIDSFDKIAKDSFEVAQVAKEMERRRVLEPLLAAMGYLEGAPLTVQMAFSVVLLEITELKEGSTQGDIHEYLKKIHVDPEAILRWQKDLPGE